MSVSRPLNGVTQSSSTSSVLRPRPSELLSRFGEQDEDGDRDGVEETVSGEEDDLSEEEAGSGGASAQKSQPYRPPKLQAVPYKVYLHFL